MIATETQTILRHALNRGIVLYLEGKADECLAHFEQLRSEFETAGPLLLAKFHNNYGLGFFLKAEVTGDDSYFYRTLSEYELVKKYLNEIDDLPAIATVEANIANVKLMLGFIDEAHEHLNVAESILSEFSDHALLARALETRARVYLKQDKIQKALEAIERSEKLFMNSVEEEPLKETLRTKAIIQEKMSGQLPATETDRPTNLRKVTTL